MPTQLSSLGALSHFCYHTIITNTLILPVLVLFVRAWGGGGGNKKLEVKLITTPIPLMFCKHVLIILCETEG